MQAVQKPFLAEMKLASKFQTTGSVSRVKSPGCTGNRSCRPEEQIDLVQDSVTASPRKSIHQRLQSVGYPDLFNALNFA